MIQQTSSIDQEQLVVVLRTPIKTSQEIRHAAHVMLQVVEIEHPPLRLPLHDDALQAIRHKLTLQLEELHR